MFKFIKFMYWLFIGKLKVNFLWYKVYRWLYEKKYKRIYRNHEWHTLTPKEAAEELSKLKWVGDGFWELGDAIHSPEYTQFILDRINTGLPQSQGRFLGRDSMDCDDFSTWACKSLKKELRPQLLAVSYAKNEGNWLGKYFSGHVVCIFIDEEEKLWHLSNWGLIGPFDMLNHVVESVLGRNRLYGWYLFTPELERNFFAAN